jgi:DNA-binding protein
MKQFPTLTTEKLLKKSGAKRVSELAKQELSDQLFEKLKYISKRSTIIAEHAGRKTIKNTDIKLSIS